MNCGTSFSTWFITFIQGLAKVALAALAGNAANYSFIVLNNTSGEIECISLETIKDCVLTEFKDNVPAFRNYNEASAGSVTSGGCFKTTIDNTLGLPEGVLIFMP